jgi:hypothetical protein
MPALGPRVEVPCSGLAAVEVHRLGLVLLQLPVLGPAALIDDHRSLLASGPGPAGHRQPGRGAARGGPGAVLGWLALGELPVVEELC